MQDSKSKHTSKRIECILVTLIAGIYKLMLLTSPSSTYAPFPSSGGHAPAQYMTITIVKLSGDAVHDERAIAHLRRIRSCSARTDPMMTELRCKAWPMSL